MLDTKDIEDLAKLFGEFPGIGERQSKRFVYFLLRRGGSYRDTLARSIKQLDQSVEQCTECYRFFSKRGSNLCVICENPSRDMSIVMIVEKDSDVDAIEKSSLFKGRYFIIGGLIPIATEDKIRHIRIKELMTYLETHKDLLKEIILGFPVHPNGDYTTEYVRQQIEANNKDSFKITVLGRGLSTGTDIEYTDRETIEYALKGRQ